MISLSDKQFAIVIDAAAELPVEKRAVLLEAQRRRPCPKDLLQYVRPAGVCRPLISA